MEYCRLGVNIDHVATVRNARGGSMPDPVRAAKLAAKAGADGITAHLREDRRHIIDSDIARLKAEIDLPLNFEMAATPEMLEIALQTCPHACCLVPEKREEKTTEGGLDVAGFETSLASYIEALKASGARISLFIEANPVQIEAAQRLGADIVELHTGRYCEAYLDEDQDLVRSELIKLREGAKIAFDLGLEPHAGHGLTYDTVKPIAEIPQFLELNIGHFLMGEAMFVGLEAAIKTMRGLIDEARS